MQAKTEARESAGLVSAVRDSRRISLRAGSGRHRFIPLWAVVVERRIFVRSWSLKPRSWWRTLLVDPRGRIRVAEQEAAFRAVHTRSTRLKAAVDRAYLAKYGSGGEARFARDMAGARSRRTTTELVLVGDRPGRAGVGRGTPSRTGRRKS